MKCWQNHNNMKPKYWINNIESGSHFLREKKNSSKKSIESALRTAASSPANLMNQLEFPFPGWPDLTHFFFVKSWGPFDTTQETTGIAIPVLEQGLHLRYLNLTHDKLYYMVKIVWIHFREIMFESMYIRFRFLGGHKYFNH